MQSYASLHAVCSAACVLLCAHGLCLAQKRLGKTVWHRIITYRAAEGTSKKSKNNKRVSLFQPKKHSASQKTKTPPNKTVPSLGQGGYCHLEVSSFGSSSRLQHAVRENGRWRGAPGPRWCGPCFTRKIEMPVWPYGANFPRGAAHCRRSEGTWMRQMPPFVRVSVHSLSDYALLQQLLFMTPKTHALPAMIFTNFVLVANVCRGTPCFRIFGFRTACLCIQHLFPLEDLNWEKVSGSRVRLIPEFDVRAFVILSQTCSAETALRAMVNSGNQGRMR